MPLTKSTEHLRIEGLVKQHPAGTRKGDDARVKLADIERNFNREEQRQAGKGQFIQAEKTKLGTKARAIRRR